MFLWLRVGGCADSVFSVCVLTVSMVLWQAYSLGMCAGNVLVPSAGVQSQYVCWQCLWFCGRRTVSVCVLTVSEVLWQAYSLGMRADSV